MRAPLIVVTAIFLSASHHVNAAPWWDDFPGIIQTPSAAQAQGAHTTASLCGASDDPCWGLYAQRMCFESFGKTTSQLHDAGLKSLSWFEGFGTCESYVAQLKRDSAGAWVQQSTNPPLTRIFSQHWAWQDFDRTGEIRWVGLPNYFDDEDFARPWTRTHPRYGSPAMRYPDGRVATGYNGPSADPRNSWVLDAGCAKDVLGHVTFEYDYNELVNRLDHTTGQPHGPTNRLVRVDTLTPGPPDPGFTPDEWKRIKKAGYAGVVSSGKDSACPIWIDYLRASVQMAVDSGTDGLWVDNFSPWDSFGGSPVTKAFGEWSVAGFRGYLKTNFSGAALAKMGVTNTESYDVRSHLCDQCKSWGGVPENLSDARWHDARWLGDPVWRAYLIYKRRVGTDALSCYYRTIKETAAASGKPDFLVMGNDIPLFSLGWVRGDLDMVSTELSWGWHLTSGPRGIMPPPNGNYTPVYKLAREHARSRFVNAWMYGTDDQMGRTNIARVLYYQALANHASPMPNPGGRTVGNAATDSEFFDFLRQVAPIFKDRQPLEEAGIYYSASSQLMEMTPGGFRDHNHQPHSFAFWGWGTTLTQLHVPWRAIPEWKLTPDTLKSLRLLIIPAAQVFDPADIAALNRWVRDGGTLIITGHSGERVGESGNFEVAAPNSLEAFAGGSKNSAPQIIGAGRVLWLTNDPGIPFYEAGTERGGMLEGFREVLKNAGLTDGDWTVSAGAVSRLVGLTPYHRPGQLTIDINNTDLDLKTDVISKTAPLQFTVKLPPDLRGKQLGLQVLSPGEKPQVEMQLKDADHIEIKVSSFTVYASVSLTAIQ